LSLDEGTVRGLSFRPDGASLLTASDEGLTLWDVTTKKGSRYAAYGSAPRDVAWYPDGASFAVARADASLAIGAPGQKSPARVVPLAGAAQAIAFGRAGTFATADYDGSVSVRDARGRAIHHFGEAGTVVRAVALADGGAV